MSPFGSGRAGILPEQLHLVGVRPTGEVCSAARCRTQQEYVHADFV